MFNLWFLTLTVIRVVAHISVILWSNNEFIQQIISEIFNFMLPTLAPIPKPKGWGLEQKTLMQVTQTLAVVDCPAELHLLYGLVMKAMKCFGQNVH